MAISELRGSFPVYVPPVDPDPDDPPPNPGPGDFEPGPAVTTFSKIGITVNFENPVSVGAYDNALTNTVWVRAVDGLPVTVTSYTPSFGTISVGRMGNGAMVDPIAFIGGGGDGSNVDDLQGFDSFLATGATVQRWSEDKTLKVPFTMEAGRVYVIARSNPTPQSNTTRGVSAFLFIYCVADLPFADELAPPYCWPASAGARPRFRFSDINQSLLPTESVVGMSPSRPSAESLFLEKQRLLTLDNGLRASRTNIQQQEGDNIFGRDLQIGFDPICAYLATDATDKDDLLRLFVQRGICTYGVFVDAASRGRVPYEPDGGHMGGRTICMTITGALLENATIRDYMKTTFTPESAGSPAEYGQRCFLTPEQVTATQQPGWTGNGAGGANNPNASYPDSMAQEPPTPEWIGKASEPFNLNNTFTGPSNYYRNTGHGDRQYGQIALLELMNLREAYGHPALYNYQYRYNQLLRQGDDPWRYLAVDEGEPRYDIIHRIEARSNPGSFEQAFYNDKIAANFPLPAPLKSPFVPRPSFGLARILENGVTLLVTSSIPLTGGTTSPADWTVWVDGVEATINTATFSGSTVTLTLANVVQGGSVLRFSYSGTGLVGGGQVATTTTDFYVRSEVPFPVINSGSSNRPALQPDGFTITGSISAPITVGTVTLSEWAITADGVNVPLVSVDVTGQSLTIILDQVIGSSASMRLFYTGTSLAHATGTPLQPADTLQVRNNSIQ